MEPIEKINEIGSLVEGIKQTQSEAKAEAKKRGEELAETKEKLEKMADAYDSLKEGYEEVKTAMNRSGGYGEANTGESEAANEYRKAFDHYVRTGDKEAIQKARPAFYNEQKALSTVSDPDGGYLVMPEMSSQIEKRIFETSPLRQIASVAQIGSGKLEIIQDNDELDLDWAAECQDASESDIHELGKIMIEAHKLLAAPKATEEILADAFLNVESWLTEKIADKAARKENLAFMLGDGIGKPRGIMDYDEAADAKDFEYGKVGTVDGGAALDFDDLHDLKYALKGAYRSRATWLMNRCTVRDVRKLKDLDGQYLWQPALQAGEPDMLMGRPILEMDDLDEVGVASGTYKPIAYGDFRTAYQIVDRVGIRILRDEVTRFPNVLFKTSKRVGGGVKNFDAYKVLKVVVP